MACYVWLIEKIDARFYDLIAQQAVDTHSLYDCAGVVLNGDKIPIRALVGQEVGRRAAKIKLRKFFN